MAGPTGMNPRPRIKSRCLGLTEYGHALVFLAVIEQYEGFFRLFLFNDAKIVVKGFSSPNTVEMNPLIFSWN